MAIKIDSEKLAGLIESLVKEVSGCCISSGACIGVVDGKHIKVLAVLPDEDDEDFPPSPKLFCLEKVENQPRHL